MNVNVVSLVAEMAAFALVYLLASALTMRLRRRCRDEDVLALGAGGVLRHVFVRLFRPLAVLALSHLARMAAESILDLGAFTRDDAWCGRHIGAWLRFWEIVALIAAVEGLAVLFYRLRRRPFPLPDLLLNIVRGALVLLAAFVVLRFYLEVDIAPLLGASALLTAVVGFALQGVLGNLLAGMSLHVVRSVIPGDWVSIDGTEGEVIHTNWRETRVRTWDAHVAIIPNSTVAAAKVLNFTRPTPLRRHVIAVGASYSDAPAEVIAALVESALGVPVVLRDPAPSAYITEYKDFGINYQLRFWTTCYINRVAIEGDVMRTIWYQFKRRGIEIPFPMSDKLLNDFMAVVYRQRRLPPDDGESERNRADLAASEFVSRMLVDEAGRPLLGDEDLAGIARAVRRVRYTSGETVFRQDEPGEACYVLTAGRVRGRMEHGGAVPAVEFKLGPGALFGEMSLLTGLPRTATISTDGEVELLEVSKEAFARLLALREDIPGVLARLVAARAEQNRAAIERLRALGVAGVDESLQSENILTRFLRLLGRVK